MEQSSPEQDNPFSDKAFEQKVREKAYELWEHGGGHPGGEQHYWYLALGKCLRQREDEERAKRGLIDPM